MSKDNVIDLKKPEPFTDDPEQSHVAIMLGFGTRVGGPGRTGVCHVSNES